MENKKQDETEEIIDTVETEKVETVHVPLPIKQTRNPIFPNGNKFNKGFRGNDFNNRQRPGRAAGRGR